MLEQRRDHDELRLYQEAAAKAGTPPLAVLDYVNAKLAKIAATKVTIQATISKERGLDFSRMPEDLEARVADYWDEKLVLADGAPVDLAWRQALLRLCFGAVILMPPASTRRRRGIENMARRLQFVLHGMEPVEPPQPAPEPTLEEVFGHVAAYYGLSSSEILGRTHRHAVARPRHVAMYVACELTTIESKEIGSRIGFHMNTVSLNRSKVVRRMKQDAALAQTVAELASQLREIATCGERATPAAA